MVNLLKMRPDQKVPRQHAKRHGITMAKFGISAAPVEGQGLTWTFGHRLPKRGR
jgi:hypothetical protein